MKISRLDRVACLRHFAVLQERLSKNAWCAQALTNVARHMAQLPAGSIHDLVTCFPSCAGLSKQVWPSCIIYGRHS